MRASPARFSLGARAFPPDAPHAFRGRRSAFSPANRLLMRVLHAPLLCRSSSLSELHLPSEGSCTTRSIAQWGPPTRLGLAASPLSLSDRLSQSAPVARYTVARYRQHALVPSTKEAAHRLTLPSPRDPTPCRFARLASMSRPASRLHSMLVLLSALVALSSPTSAAPPVRLNARAVSLPLTCRTGTFQGKILSRVEVWRGVPYAQPPVGDLRFERPQPVPEVGLDDPTFGVVRDATAFKPRCLQTSSKVRSFHLLSFSRRSRLMLTRRASRRTPRTASTSTCTARRGRLRRPSSPSQCTSLAGRSTRAEPTRTRRATWSCAAKRWCVAHAPRFALPCAQSSPSRAASPRSSTRLTGLCTPAERAHHRRHS